MSILPSFGAAWSPSDASRDLVIDLEEARTAAKLTRQQCCGILQVSESRLSEMEKGLDAGPGILRYAGMPARFWIVLLKARVIRAALRMVGEDDLRQLIDLVQVWLLERQLRKPRMVKCVTPTTEERKRA